MSHSLKRARRCPSRRRPTHVLLLAAWAMMPVATLRADDLVPMSRVTAVTVYRQQALVSREARLTLPPGDGRIVLEDLPSVVDPNSFRVSGRGASGIEIRGVEVRQQFREPGHSAEYRELETALDDFGRQQAAISDRTKSIAALREFLGTLKATAGEEASKDLLTRGFAVDSWQKAFEFLSGRLDHLSAEERDLNVKSKTLAKQIEVTRGKLAQLASQGGIARYSATILVSSRQGGEVTLTASYLAANASWAPLYEAHLDPAAGKANLVWQAQIAQSTGEDWKGVSVTLATTQPSAGIDLPKLASLRLFQAPAGFSAAQFESLPVIGRNYQDVLTLAPGTSDVDGDGNVGDGLSKVATVITPAAAARREVAVVFDLPGVLDIPSDGQPHTHLIATRTLDAQLERQAIPLLVPKVFLVARLTLTGEIPLLRGPVQHFVGDDLVGRSIMVDRAAGEEFALPFGPDDRLRADRKQVFRRVELKGKDDELDYRYLTTLENHLGQETEIVLKDRIPVSGDERITVTLDKDETSAGFTTDPNEPGILTWSVRIPSGGKKELVLRYRVRKPRDMAVAGLD